MCERGCFSPSPPPADCASTPLSPLPCSGAPNCCSCAKAPGTAAKEGAGSTDANTTDAAGDTKTGGNGDNGTKAGEAEADGNNDGDGKGGKGDKNDSKNDDSKKDDSEKDEDEGKKKGDDDKDDKKGRGRSYNSTDGTNSTAAQPLTPAGVYLFAQTFVTNFTEEQVREQAGRGGVAWHAVESVGRGWVKWAAVPCIAAHGMASQG